MLHYARPSPRRGSLSVEMIGVLVVLLILMVGIVQFGVFLGNAQIVALAAKVAGEEASRTISLPLNSGDPVPTNVVEAMQRHLESSQIKYCALRMEHNATLSGNPLVLTHYRDPLLTCDCGPGAADFLMPAPGDQYVRVTVCVPLAQVMPAGLSLFGGQLFSSTDTYEHTAVYRYQTP